MAPDDIGGFRGNIRQSSACALGGIALPQAAEDNKKAEGMLTRAPSAFFIYLRIWHASA